MGILTQVLFSKPHSSIYYARILYLAVVCYIVCVVCTCTTIELSINLVMSEKSSST